MNPERHEHDELLRLPGRLPAVHPAVGRLRQQIARRTPTGIEMPGYDWHIDDYTEFTAELFRTIQQNQYYGAMDTPHSLHRTPERTTMWASLAEVRPAAATFVNMNSPQVRSMIQLHRRMGPGSTFWGRYDEEIASIPECHRTGGDLDCQRRLVGLPYVPSRQTC
ncbi:MAG: hypothetical protein MZU79_02810 [Anaerotruncus sp.]|nr:hypothetical protein [Anaerotruncus sp.]